MRPVIVFKAVPPLLGIGTALTGEKPEPFLFPFLQHTDPAPKIHASQLDLNRFEKLVAFLRY